MIGVNKRRNLVGATLSATWASDVDNPTVPIPFDCSDNADIWE
jgi:hypothetical protein